VNSVKPIVAVIGRPNVGKSTFFNRVTRSRDAIVDDTPGVTRDRHTGSACWNDRHFLLVDTGGFISGDEDRFAASIQEQVHLAVAEADALVVIFDGRAGLTPFDRDLAALVRSVSKPVFFVVNKIDGEGQEKLAAEFFALGVARLYTLSAEHGYGVGELLDDLAAALPRMDDTPDPERIRVAVVGRPNVGKSSLVNRLLGQERLLVSPLPGTTRDAIDTPLRHQGTEFLLIDTAGIRRRGKTEGRLEKFSVLKALRGLQRCDVALVVMDAAEGVTDQDLTVAGYVHEQGRGCVMVLNKWDLVARQRPDRDPRQILREKARFLGFAPQLTVSARSGLRVDRILPQVRAVYDQYRTRIGTGVLNTVLAAAVARNEPPLVRGRRLKFFYATQIATGPPTIVLFVNYPEAVHFSYQRYLINRFREESGLSLTPIRLLFRPRSRRQHPGQPKPGKPPATALD
jgi:GTP-binding protein